MEVPDPLSGKPKHYPFQTNLVYSWLRIHARSAGEDCGLQYPPPEWIVLRYQVLTLAFKVFVLVVALNGGGESGAEFIYFLFTIARQN